MSTLKAHNIEPATGSDVALGAAGDSITVSGDSLKLNTFKDAGGNTLFTSDGSGTLSSVNGALGGEGPKLILSQTASGSANVAFTSGLTSTYDKYMFVFVNINPATDSAFFTFQVSTNGGSSYGVAITSTMFVATVGEDGSNGRTEYVDAGDLDNATGYQPLGLYIGSAADESFSGQLNLFGPSSTTYVKHFLATGNLVSSSVYARNPYVGGYVNSTSAVNAINFKMSTGNFDGIIKMYGIK